MKKITLLLIVLSISSNVFSQNKKYYGPDAADTIEKDYKNLFLISSSYDSLIVEKKVYYFKNSPINYIKGFMDVLYDEVMVLPEIDPGYRLLWTIRNDKLYIREIQVYRSDYKTTYRPSGEEARNRLEEFTGRKFEGDGLLADFVTGKFILYKYPLTLRQLGDKKDKYTAKEEDKYRIGLIEKQEIYTIEFGNGKLIKLVRDKELEEEYRKREKYGYGV